MNSTNSKKLFIVAGEPSGDLHGSSLIKALKQLSPDMQITGLGGGLMESAGARLICRADKYSVVGFAEVIRKLPAFRKLFRRLAAKLDAERPDAVVLIDYPGFNLKFAKEAKKRNIPVIYYVSPQLWAWDKNRVMAVKNLVDRMLVIFEFERDFYKRSGIEAVFVGHPLVDIVKTTTDVGARCSVPLQSDKKTIALLPGSRMSEVGKILPVMLKSAEIISRYTCHSEGTKPSVSPRGERPKNLKERFFAPLRGAQNDMTQSQFILIKSPIVSEDVYVGATRRVAPTLPVKIIADNRYDAVSCSDFALVASGTATLETAILGVPMALVYKVSFLTWLIARLLIRIPYIGLVNVVAGKKIIPEFIQFGARPAKIAAECLDILNSPERISIMKSQLAEVKKKLGPAGASQKAAEEILRFLG